MYLLTGKLTPGVTMKHLSIAETAFEDRPRERLIQHGPNALSNSELLAIIIGSGSNKESVLELSTRVTKTPF